MQRGQRQSPRQNTWPQHVMATIALCVLAGAAFLYALSVSETPVDMIATARTITFTTGRDEVVLEPILADEVVVIGDGKVQGAAGVNSIKDSITISRAASSMPLTIQAITLKPGTIVTVRMFPGQSRAFEFFVRPPAGTAQTAMTVFAGDGYRMGADRDAKPTKPPGSPEKTGPPQSLYLEMAGDHLLFRAKFAEVDWGMRQPFTIKSLSFFDVEPGKDGAPSIFSTVMRGNMSFEVLKENNKTREIRSGQPLRLAIGDVGYLRQMKLTDGGIEIEAYASVTELKTEWRAGESRDEKPSMLEALMADKLVVAAGALAALVGKLFEILGKWRRHP